MHLDKNNWLTTPPHLLATMIFAASGPLAALMPGYKVNPVQIDYAATVIETLRRGLSDQGRVTYAEASTGVGKTLGYMIAGMIDAVLTGRRLMVSTYTLELQRQVIEEDGPIAAAVTHALTGRRPTLSARRARTQFASPERCRRLAFHSSPPIKKALNSLADFADDAIASISESAENDDLTWTRASSGLIDLWTELNPREARALERLDRDVYALDATCEDREQIPWMLASRHAKTAEILITTHASTIIDLKVWGRLHGGPQNPFGLVILDEADRLEAAASSVLGVNRSINGFGHSARALQTAVAAAPATTIQRSAAADAIVAFINLSSLLEDALKKITPLPDAPLSVSVNANAPWVSALRALRDALDPVEAAVAAFADENIASELQNLQNKMFDVDHFVDSIKPATNRGRPLSITALEFSPVHRDATLRVHAIRGARLVSRFWNEKIKMADALLLTSATLAFPGKPVASAFAFMTQTIGLWDETRVNADLNVQLEPKIFGDPSFVLADPKAPVPNRDENDDRDIRSEAWLAYAADGIVAAAARTKSRTLVLATSHADAEALSSQVLERLGSRLVTRSASDSLRKAFDAFADLPDGVLITAGAWEGVNKPGLFQTLVIPRLPFSPGDIFPAEGGAEAPPTSSLWAMIRLLKQGLGRAIRRADDKPDIWILDPRIGLPESLKNTFRNGRFLAPHPQSKAIYLAAIPRRFLPKLKAAELFEVTNDHIKTAKHGKKSKAIA